MQWLLLFFPKWQFFGEVGSQPQVFVMINNEWQPLLREEKFSFWHFIFNPWGNLKHAIQNNLISLRQEFAEEEDAEIIKESRQYEVLEGCVEYQLRHYHPYGLRGKIPFKVELIDLETDERQLWLESEVILGE